jgi:hypothetical protein
MFVGKRFSYFYLGRQHSCNRYVVRADSLFSWSLLLELLSPLQAAVRTCISLRPDSIARASSAVIPVMPSCARASICLHLRPPAPQKPARHRHCAHQPSEGGAPSFVLLRRTLAEVGVYRTYTFFHLASTSPNLQMPSSSVNCLQYSQEYVYSRHD